MTHAGHSDLRPRVMHCITRLGLGGAERVALSINRVLAAEVDFAVFTAYGAAPDAVGDAMQQELRELKVPWFAGTRLPMKCGGPLPGGLALRRAVRAFRPDVLHFHSETPEACGAMMLQLFPTRHAGALVRTIHNSIFWRYWPRIGRWCDHQLSRAHVACVSAAAREEFLRYRADSGAVPPPETPVVIRNGVALPCRAPRVGPLAPDRRRVLFAGRLEFQKGADVLCRALPSIRLPVGVRGHLTVLGHGADETMFRQLAAAPPAGWEITLRPPVPSLEQVLPEFDLIVMPSRFEGLGLVAIEATLSGLPVVVTDAPGLRETVPANFPWRAVPGNAESLARELTAALADTARWAGVMRAAQDFALARFSPAAMGEGYRQLYHRARARGRAK